MTIDLQQIREFLTQNADNEEVRAFLNELRTPSLDDIKRLAEENEEVKTWLQSEKDRHFSKGLETWKQKTLPSIIEEEIKKRYPEETPEQRELKKLRAEIEQMRREKEREALRAKAKDLAIEKKLPSNLVDFFVADTEEKTLENLNILEQVWTQSLQNVVGETFKQHGREPHKPQQTQSIENPWRKETFNLTKQAQILKENPELAKQLMNQAKE
ncbi:DUF4355 domain-containing protein [Thermoflavimicrobium dichotomicum]|uniref:DUF4355 domain-containing protein n=1 Tax=Thermoflavimicrobium dichotomicum TaxID=46223 RepID=A0A1I3UJP7_9BACL|nr:DUF4355 domain-containing protein [Thermoflavimicrobium dichotomicum]SFJ83132.1 protein of unknown function [Thermoflavimicrobium dichotomicum]